MQKIVLSQAEASRLKKAATQSRLDFFIQKESRLKQAIERVKSKLQQYKEESDKIEGYWTDADRERFKDWNNYHDLQYRLEERVWANWSAYHDWHFEQYGFNAYNF